MYDYFTTNAVKWQYFAVTALNAKNDREALRRQRKPRE